MWDVYPKTYILDTMAHEYYSSIWEAKARDSVT